MSNCRSANERPACASTSCTSIGNVRTAKRNTLLFESIARTIVFYDRTGKRTDAIGERALYDAAVISPDGSRVAVVKGDLANESADLFVIDISSGTSARLTTSARTESVASPIWAPDGSRIAYVAVRNGQEGIYVRPANGQGDEKRAEQAITRVH